MMRFDLGEILSVTTERLLTRPDGPHDNGIGRMYKLLEHMTGEAPFTHQLPRFAKECQPWLLKWFPELANVTDETINAAVERSDTLEYIAARHGLKLTYDVGTISDHMRRNPIEELAGMVDADKIIVVETL